MDAIKLNVPTALKLNTVRECGCVWRNGGGIHPHHPHYPCFHYYSSRHSNIKYYLASCWTNRHNYRNVQQTVQLHVAFTHPSPCAAIACASAPTLTWQLFLLTGLLLSRDMPGNVLVRSIRASNFHKTVRYNWSHCVVYAYMIIWSYGLQDNTGHAAVIVSVYCRNYVKRVRNSTSGCTVCLLSQVCCVFSDVFCRFLSSMWFHMLPTMAQAGSSATIALCW